MNNIPYTGSFAAGSLLHKETNAILPLLLSENSTDFLKQEIQQNKLLKINSESARKRTVMEIVKRFSVTNKSFWDFYMLRNEEEQKLLLFYQCLRVYRLMFDFHFNVTIKQWNSSTPKVEPYLYQMELNEIAGRDEKVYKWTDLTKSKVISVYMRILKDINILDAKTYQLKSIIVTDESFFGYFIKAKDLWFLDACLLSSQSKKQIIERAL
jgi:hypothetical protein